MGFGELAKEAARLKKEKRFDEACRTLQIAYQSADVGEVITVSDFAILPMYLYYAGRTNEGWAELNRLSMIFVTDSEQLIIRNKMMIFARSEGRIGDALFFKSWTYVLDVFISIDEIIKINNIADGVVSYVPEVVIMPDGTLKEMNFNTSKNPVAYTPNGSPIYDIYYNGMLEHLNTMLSFEKIEVEMLGLCGELQREDLAPAIANEIIDIVQYRDGSNEWISSLKKFFNQQLLDNYVEGNYEEDNE